MDDSRGCSEVVTPALAIGYHKSEHIEICRLLVGRDSCCPRSCKHCSIHSIAASDRKTLRSKC